MIGHGLRRPAEAVHKLGSTAAHQLDSTAEACLFTTNYVCASWHMIGSAYYISLARDPATLPQRTRLPAYLSTCIFSSALCHSPDPAAWTALWLRLSGRLGVFFSSQQWLVKSRRIRTVYAGYPDTS